VASAGILHRASASGLPARAAWTSGWPRRSETFFTVWTNVFQRGRLQAGESPLVHGGSAASELPRFVAKARRAWLATAGSPENARRASCSARGCDYRNADLSRCFVI
jgi:NADPH2:quinone reductase